MPTQTILPAILSLAQNARLYKYVKLPKTGWKYVRAVHEENYIKLHPVYLLKANHPTTQGNRIWKGLHLDLEEKLLARHEGCEKESAGGSKSGKG